MERHILIVDDEPNILSALERLLEEEGYIVYSANGGEEGIAIIDANPQIGVVLSDQRMPNMTGTEFLKKIKLSHSNVVRMILSGYAELNTITQAINEGSIFKFHTKPWDEDLLLKSIQESFEYYELTEINRRLAQELYESNSKLTEFNISLEQMVEEKTHHLQVHIASLNVYQVAMECFPFAIIGLDESLTIALENRAARDLFSSETKSVLGLPANIVFQDEWHSLVGLLKELNTSDSKATTKRLINQRTMIIKKLNDESERLGYLIVAIPDI